MADLFLNPWAMAAGALLVSAPIIIHLINRIRFRRVRWAAMEFLLKSQKKQQRKLLIEQLILLALRCLLVLLAGLLLARFVGRSLAGAEAGTRHIVVLDDTPSMGDFWNVDGKPSDSFGLAKQYIVEQIVQAAAQASGAQTVEVLPLTEPDESRTFELTGTGAAEELRSYLDKLSPSAVHVGPAEGLVRARGVVESNPKQRCLVHFVSDFRATDWSGRSVEDVKRAAEALTRAGAQLHLHDVAHPYRQEQRTPISHDNLAVLDLQPETRVVARFQPVEFFVTLANYSNGERKNLRVIVKVNGEERAEASFPVPVLPPGLTQRSFIVWLDRVAKPDKPRERFSVVSASLDKGDAGLVADKTRFATVEVREKLKLLMVEGTPGKPDDENADGYYLRKLYAESLQGFEVVSRPATELEQPGLGQYTGVFVLNVPRITDKAKQNLDAYVRGGGGLAFFMGPGINPEAYTLLHEGGKGLFPVPLADKPTDSRWQDPFFLLLEAMAKARDERERERVRQQLAQLQARVRVFVRNETTPLLAGLYRYDRLESFKLRLPYIPFDRYFPVPRARWGAAAEQCDEVLTFPNDRAIDDFKDEAQRLAGELPEADSRFARFSALLRGARQRLVQVLANGKYLFQLANEIDDLLTNRGDPREPDQPSLYEFWQQADVAELRTRFAKLLDAVRYGDPLLVAKARGQGRVVAFLSSAGPPWNRWPVAEGKQFVSSFVAFGDELQRFLNGAGVTTNDLAGRPVALTLYEPERLASVVQRSFLSEAKGPDGLPVFSDLGPQEGTKKDGQLTFAIDQTRLPGVYVFAVPQAADRPDAPTEYRSRAVNVDALAESDLRRAGRDDLTGVAAGTMVHFPGSTQLAGVLRPKPRDWSESAWLFVLILLVLVAEQAMAVRLSFHVKGGPQPVTPRPAAVEVTA